MLGEGRAVVFLLCLWLSRSIKRDTVKNRILDKVKPRRVESCILLEKLSGCMSVRGMARVGYA